MYAAMMVPFQTLSAIEKEHRMSRFTTTLWLWLRNGHSGKFLLAVPVPFS